MHGILQKPPVAVASETSSRETNVSVFGATAIDTLNNYGEMRTINRVGGKSGDESFNLARIDAVLFGKLRERIAVAVDSTLKRV